MPRHTSIAFLLIVGLSFIDTTHADESVSSYVETPAAHPKSFVIDFDSASLQKRQAYGIDLDAEGISEARNAAAAALPSERGVVKQSWLIVYDSAAFDLGFFDGPILLELPTGRSCVAHPHRIKERKNGSKLWIGRCKSSIASGDVISLNVYPRKKLITGYIRWGKQHYDISSTRKKPFHVIYQYNLDYVPKRPLTY